MTGPGADPHGARGADPARGELRVLPDPEALSRAAAEELAAAARAAQAEGARAAVALSGGSTPRRMLEILAAPPYAAALPWQAVELFFGDERCVPPDHPDSNYGMARRALLEPLALSAARVHRMRGEEPEPDAAARAYQREIAAALGADEGGPPPALDLVFLGLGPDGHTASLFPHTEALAERRRWVVANFVPKLGAHRITLSVPLLRAARRVVFLVAGEDKAAVLAAVLEGPATPQELPAQLVRPDPGQLLWLVDRAAAARLGRGG